VIAFGPGFLTMVAALTIGGAFAGVRLIRGTVLSEKQRQYVEAARALGVTDARIIARHLFPNILPLVIVSISLRIPAVILAEASLSFLGLGIPPPTPSWGADQPPFNDPRVRQAIYAALDIKDLITRVDLGEGEWTGPVPAYLPTWGLPEAEVKAAFPNDPKKARDLLTAAGFDFNREWELKYPSREKSQTIAEVLQKHFGAAGIKTKLIPEDPATVWAPQTMANKTF